MKYLILCLTLLCVVACGRSDETAAAQDDPQSLADQAVAEAQETVERIKRGEPLGESEGTEKCSVFDSGLVEEFFQTGDFEVVYSSSIPSRRAGHVVCRALWDKPNKEQIEQAFQQAMMEWAKSIGSADKKPQPKMVSSTNEVSLTVVANTFDSAADAVASLEQTVATMSEGITVEIQGKTHETKMQFGPWIEGVGDKAIWSDKGGLNFAYDARRYTLNVSVYEDGAKNREAAIELAQLIINML
jgi:hypothetical protein